MCARHTLHMRMHYLVLVFHLTSSGQPTPQVQSQVKGGNYTVWLYTSLPFCLFPKLLYKVFQAPTLAVNWTIFCVTHSQSIF